MDIKTTLMYMYNVLTGRALLKTLIATSVNLSSPLKTGPNPPSPNLHPPIEIDRWSNPLVA